MLQQCASIERSVLSVAVVVGHVSVARWDARSADLARIYSDTPPAARPALRWLMTHAGFSRRELATVLKRGLLVWSPEQRRLVYGMTWARRLAALAIGGFGVGFWCSCLHLIWHGVNSFTWAMVLVVCGAFTTGSLAWLQRHYFAPRAIALRALQQLEKAPEFRTFEDR